MPHTLILTDDDPGIDIAKSGAPEPSATLVRWLDTECTRPWRWDCDTAFNVYFRFEGAEDARRFKERWGAREA